jgi:phosphoribosylformylglycinamidine synthase subunit PurS
VPERARTARERLPAEPSAAGRPRPAGRRLRARVLIRPKAGILDPQGVAVERALPALGFTGVAGVHVGRLVELDVEDPAQLESMCERLLANPLVEDYEIELLDGAA